MEIEAQIREKLEKCIIDTNKVILRWLGINTRIVGTDKAVRSLFNGYLNKYFNIHHIDFKRLMKCINVHTADNFLIAVIINDHLLTGLHFKQRDTINLILTILPKINIESLNFREDYQPLYTGDIKQLNFKKLELITF